MSAQISAISGFVVTADEGSAVVWGFFAEIRSASVVPST